MIHYNILIISGTGQNIGKTTLACKIIENNILDDIIAIKISPHFHNINSSDKIIFNNSEYTIIEETNTDTGKDSSKMLKSGAKKVFYIQCTDEELINAFNKLKTIIPINSNLIIESGSARKNFKPNLFIMIKHFDITKIKKKSAPLLKLADLIITFNNNSYNFDSSQISIIKNKWVIK